MNRRILFDVDGMLWDSATQAAESQDGVLACYSYLRVRITVRGIHDNIGKIMMDTGRTLFPGLAQEEYKKVMGECMTYKSHYLLTHPRILYPEAGEIMTHLSRQYGLYITNNCQSGYIEVLLKSCGLREYVRDIEYYGNTGLPKRDSIRMVVRRNHLGRCFYMDDTHMDGEAAGITGIPFVHASYGFGRAKRPVSTVESSSRLPALAEKLLDQEQDMDQEECKEVKQALELFLNESLERVLMSNPADSSIISRSRIRPLFMEGRLVFQTEEQAGRQASHRNLDEDEVADYVVGLLEGPFRQVEITSGLGEALILISKKGRVTVKMKRYPESARIQLADEPGSPGSLSHSRKKHYILEEGIPVLFLMDLDVMVKEGRMVNSRYDKCRQINRFLEFTKGTLPNLNQGRKSAIIDFGCGKSYLTFAIYYYLKKLKGYPVRIIDLGLKEDVVEHYSRLERQYGHDGPSFYHGDIASFESMRKMDVAVTLHAYGLAMDYVLERVVNQGARVILSVPYYQYELDGQMENNLPRLVLQYDPIKECMVTLYTDAIRTQVLEYRGYRTRILGFIDMEHTPKNILIQAVRQGRKWDNSLRIRELAEFLHVRPTMVELLAPEPWEPREKTTDM